MTILFVLALAVLVVGSLWHSRRRAKREEDVRHSVRSKASRRDRSGGGRGGSDGSSAEAGHGDGGGGDGGGE